MSKEKTGFSRRDFLKTAGVAGIGTVLSPVDSLATISEQFAQNTGDGLVPKRPFGKTGENVPILGLGGMFDIPSNQLLMKQADKMGRNLLGYCRLLRRRKQRKGDRDVL